MLTYCYGNRGHAPHLNRIVGVQLGSSRRAGLALRAHPGSPNTPSPDHGLGQNPGKLGPHPSQNTHTHTHTLIILNVAIFSCVEFTTTSSFLDLVLDGTQTAGTAIHALGPIPTGGSPVLVPTALNTGARRARARPPCQTGAVTPAVG